MNKNLLDPPENNSILHLIAGQSGPGEKILNNLPLVFFEFAKNLEDEDVLFLGGDFVELCLDCCINNSTNPANNPYLNDSEICGSSTLEPGSCSCQKTINGGSVPISCCYSNNKEFFNDSKSFSSEFKKAYGIPGVPVMPANYNGTQESLIIQLITSMNSGAKVILLTDYMFIHTIYPDNKPRYDYLIQRLSSSPNFYHYIIPSWRDRHDPIHNHAKICNVICVDKKNNYKNPYMKGIWGSFNPAYPQSITNEIGIIICGLLSNKFITTLLQYLLCMSYFFIRMPRSIIINGVSENPTLSTYGGIINNESYQYDRSQLCSVGKKLYIGNYSSNPPGVPPDQLQGFGPDKNTEISFAELIEPLTTLQKLLLTINPKLPSKNGMADIFNMKNTDPITIPLIRFCGKEFRENYSNNPIPENPPHNRIYFEDTNVTFTLGVESMYMSNFKFPQPGRTFIPDNWLCGIDVVSQIFDDAKKWVKIGIMSGIIDCADSYTGPCQKDPCCYSSNEKWLLGSQIKQTLAKEIPIFVLENQHYNSLNIFSIPGANENLYARWWTQADGPLHWKFYMNENSVLFSTQHPTSFFYNCGKYSQPYAGTMGYDLKIDSISIANYFSNIFQYQWNGAESSSNVSNVSPKTISELPCPNDDSGYCLINDSVPCSSCFDGGPKSNTSPTPSPSKPNSTKKWYIPVIIILSIAMVLFLILGFIYILTTRKQIKNFEKLIEKKI